MLSIFLTWSNFGSLCVWLPVTSSFNPLLNIYTIPVGGLIALSLLHMTRISNQPAILINEAALRSALEKIERLAVFV